MRGGACKPANSLGDEEVGTCYEEDEGPRAAVARAGEVGGFGFSCKKSSAMSSGDA